MRRLKDDRGATAIFLALLMVPLLCFGAISVDVAGIYARKQQVQNAADAGALAVAQECAAMMTQTPNRTASQRAAQSCIDPSLDINTVPRDLATANVDATATGQVTNAPLYVGTGTVTVKATDTRTNAFGAAVGLNQTTISATASARWGVPASGPVNLPATYSWCEWSAQTNGGSTSPTATYEIDFSKTSGVRTCTGPSMNIVPGGFAWVDPDPGVCGATFDIGEWATSKTGISVPGTCGNSDFMNLVGRTFLIPIFDNSQGTGNNASYHIYGFAAFTLLGYNFRSQYIYNPPGGPSCSKPDCILGHYTQFVTSTDDFTLSQTAPQLGAVVVELNS
jgi:Flp pilus assembly protein TadG